MEVCCEIKARKRSTENDEVMGPETAVDEGPANAKACVVVSNRKEDSWPKKHHP